MQITRYPSLTEDQFLGCISAFADSLAGTLNSAVMYLHKLEGQPKGAAFAFEIQLDQGRYGAAMVLDRWGAFVAAFAAASGLDRFRPMMNETPARVEQAVGLLEQANQALDAAPRYTESAVAMVESAFQTVQLIFDEERRAAEQAHSLGPMLPAGFHECRRVFLGDLNAR